MPYPYSTDFRQRVISWVENGDSLMSLWRGVVGLKVKACLTRPIWFSSTRLLPIPRWQG